MADRKNFYFRQQVTESELDAAFTGLENADRAVVEDILGKGFIISASKPATVVEQGVPDLTVQTNEFVGYDGLGRRLSNELSGFQGASDLGAAPQTVDMETDELGAPTSVATPGNEKTLSIFIEFARDESDARLDGNGAPINFNLAESIKFNVAQSAEAPVGTSVPPVLRANQLLLADIVIVEGQTAILNADIDQTRREDFLLKFTHGSTHTENGADPIPNATPSEGGLHSAADKTKLDAIDFSETGVSDLFQTRAEAFQPANVVAPAATTLDVSGAMAAKTPGGDSSTEGVVTDAPNNRVIIKDADFDDFLDGAGNRVYGRLTEAAGTWTLSFYTVIDGSGETAFDMTPFGGAAVQWWVQETFKLENLPTFNGLFSIPSDQVAAEVPDATRTQRGKIEQATEVEALAGTDDQRAITPLVLKAVTDALGIFIPQYFFGTQASYTPGVGNPVVWTPHIADGINHAAGTITFDSEGIYEVTANILSEQQAAVYGIRFNGSDVARSLSDSEATGDDTNKMVTAMVTVANAGSDELEIVTVGGGGPTEAGATIFSQLTVKKIAN